MINLIEKVILYAIIGVAPPAVIAVGNPCRIVRKITEDDRDYYYKDRKFDVDDYK